jgi:hypothetical protein
VEEWRVLRDFPMYEVSNLGSIRNRRTGRIIQQSLSSGRPLVGLRRDGRTHMRMVSQLVASAFLDTWQPGRYVGHGDNDLGNNEASNLYMIRQ